MKKTRNSMWISFAKYLAFAFLLGYLFSFVMYQGYWYPVYRGTVNIAWYMWPIGFILTFFFTLFIHELGHLVAFMYQNIHIRALYVFIFVFFRSEKGFRVKIQPKLWYLIGGFVVPDLPKINNDETYDQIIRKFSVSLITAPMVTVILMIVIDVSFILSVIFYASSSFLGWMFLIALFTTFISLIYIRTFSLSNRSFYGDFVAYKKMKTDPIFQMIQVIQYQQFSLTEDEPTTLYLHNKLSKLIEVTSLNTSLFHQILLMQYIEHIIYDHLPQSDVVHNKLKQYPQHHLYRTLEGLTLLYDIAAYHYHQNEVEQAYQMLDMCQKKAHSKIDSKQRHYLDIKYKHILHYEYHEAELSQLSDVYLGQEQLFEAILDLKTLKKASHEPLPFQSWCCPLILDQIPEEK